MSIDLISTGVPFTIHNEQGKTTSIQPLSTLLEGLYSRDAFLQDTIRSLREENEGLRKPIASNETIQALTSELDTLKSRLAGAFWITPEEQQKINEWKQQHIDEYHSHSSYGGAIGGMFTYEFIPTSIGTIGSCLCGECRRQSLIEACGNCDMAADILKSRNGEITFRDIL